MLGRFGSPAAMLPSALSVSSLFGNSVHHEIRLFGVQALRSSDRPLSLIGWTEVRSRSRLKIRSDRATRASAARIAVPGSSPLSLSGRRLIVSPKPPPGLPLDACCAMAHIPLR